MSPWSQKDRGADVASLADLVIGGSHFALWTVNAHLEPLFNEPWGD